MKLFTKVISTVFLIVINCTLLLSQTRDVQQITIISSWGGLGEPKKDELVIRPSGSGYRANGKQVERRWIDDLLRAIDEPEIKSLSPANIGITQAWLNANAQAAADKYPNRHITEADPNQRELFLSSFKNEELVARLLPTILRGAWTDDYPHLQIEVVEKDQRKTVITTDEQAPFMLPFEIDRGGTKVRTYNANLSRAVAALLPQKFTNKHRLSGNGFREDLAEAVMRRIDDQWDFMWVENRAGLTLDALRKNYKITSATITGYHGADHGKEWIKGDPGEQNVFLVMENETMPERFAIRLILPFRDKKVENVDLFTGQIRRYIDTVFSVPWLKDRIETERQNVWLRFVKDRSLSEKAMQTFANEMNALGKESLVQEVERHQKEIALISVGGGLDYYQSYWLVMPDRRLIFWRYGLAPWLGWTKDDFTSKVCSSYHSGTVRCVGAVISPDGKVITP